MNFLKMAAHLIGLVRIVATPRLIVGTFNPREQSQSGVFRSALGDPKLPEKTPRIGKQFFVCRIMNEGADAAGIGRVCWYSKPINFFSKAMADIGGNVEQQASL